MEEQKFTAEFDISPPVRIAFGCQSRVGKDESVKYLIEKYGGTKISFAEPLYMIQNFAQLTCKFPQGKDRRFLEWVGTEWARKRDPDVWVNLALGKAKTIKGNIYISDIRFPNELITLKKQGWFTIKILREDSLRTEKNTYYVNEEILLGEDYNNLWDVTLYNNSRLEDLYKSLDDIMNKNVV